MLTRLQKSMKDKDKGFTLIELLVVIVIIGILAAIAIPLFLNQRKKGVDASMKSDAKSAATTVETWMVDNPTTATPPVTVVADALRPGVVRKPAYHPSGIGRPGTGRQACALDPPSCGCSRSPSSSSPSSTAAPSCSRS
jgi:prepilin-type N-terminal cleavage/methylation domain-containing protein